MKIDLYHIDAMEAPHYEPIWRELCAMGVAARLVCVPGVANAAAHDWFDFERAARDYRAREVPFHTEADPEAHAVTTQNSEILDGYGGLHVRLMYGAAVFPTAWGLSERSVSRFDLILCHGPMYAEHFARWKDPQRLPLAGFPRFDGSFAGSVDPGPLRSELGLDGARPVAVYFPTWEDNSSLDRFLDAVVDLQRDFDVVLKPHHCTLRMEPERMARVRACGLRIAESSRDLESLFALADVVLADARSGAFTEAILLDRPAIGLVADPLELEDWLRPTGTSRLAPLCTQPELLGSEATQAISGSRCFPLREQWRDCAVSFRDGSAAQRAAQALVAAIERFAKPDP